MVVLPIRKWNDIVLKQKAEKVNYKKEKEVIKALINDMIETMIIEKGAGLAANQVGVLKRVIVMNTGKEKENINRKDIISIINPQIIEAKGEQISEEGCLSLPNITCKIKRSKEVVISGLDAAGKRIKLLFEDFPACIVQHEIDHLDGILIIDRVSEEERLQLVMKLTKENI